MTAGRTALMALSVLCVAFAFTICAKVAAEPAGNERVAAAPMAATATEKNEAAPPAPASPEVSSKPNSDCSRREDLLGVSRIVEIDTATGPRFGDQYVERGETAFLEDREVILTFDDGPVRRYTGPILAALDAECTKATFFAVGRMAIADPMTLRDVAARGHTIATHTWSHKKLSSLNAQSVKYEVELGLSAVAKAAGVPIAPFFRFPYLGDNKASLAYVAGRGLGIFGIHVDSRDFRTRSPGTVLRTVMSQLEREGKGIILFHDIQPSTAGAIASVLAELKEKGFKVVHMIPKTPATTLPEFDAIAEKALNAKLATLSKTPLADRAATWPVSNGVGAGTNEVLPWATPAAAATPPASKQSNRRKPSIDVSPPDDRWQIRTMGD